MMKCPFAAGLLAQAPTPVMPLRPPPRNMRTDNIKRVLDRDLVDALLRALKPLPSKSGPWMDRDPQALEGWWLSVLNDPRARRSRQERLPETHADAAMRLDRCGNQRLTVSCVNCRVSAVYAVADLIERFRPDFNVLTLPRISCLARASVIAAKERATYARHPAAIRKTCDRCRAHSISLGNWLRGEANKALYLTSHAQ